MSDQMRKFMNLMEDTSGSDAAVKSGVLQMLARDNINTLADWNALSRREKYRYGDLASDLFYNHGWIDDEAMPDSAMFADMIDSVLSDTNKAGNNDDRGGCVHGGNRGAAAHPCQNRRCMSLT